MDWMAAGIGKATMSPWSRCLFRPRLMMFQVWFFSRRARKKAVPLIFPWENTSLIHMFSAMGNQYCHGKNSPAESMYTTRKMPASWMALATGRYFPSPHAYRTSPSMPRDFHHAGSSRLAYSVRMRSGSSPSCAGAGMMALLSMPIRWKALQKAPESRQKKVWSPLKGTGVQVYHFMMP